MKIALFTPSWPGEKSPNGITTVTLELTGGLESLGHDVSIVTPDAEVDAPNVFMLSRQRAPTLRERIAYHIGRRNSVFVRAAEAIARATEVAIAERGVEVLVIEETQGLAGLVQDMLAIPVVVVLHGPWFIHRRFGGVQSTQGWNNAKRIEREWDGIKACAAVISPSHDVLTLVGRECGLGGKRQAVIPNPISLKTPIEYDGLDEVARRSLLFVGRFDRIKGGDLVLEAFIHLIGNGVDAILTFVGADQGIQRRGTNGPEEGIEAALAHLPDAIRARVKYLGPRSKSEIDDLRRFHLAAIVASRYETFGITVTESMATGAATVGTNVGGIPEIIQHERNGLLAIPDDPVSLADCCARLLAAPELAKRLGEQARSDVAERLSPLAVGRRMAAFLEETLQGER